VLPCLGTCVHVPHGYTFEPVNSNEGSSAHSLSLSLSYRRFEQFKKRSRGVACENDEGTRYAFRIGADPGVVSRWALNIVVLIQLNDLRM